ncbi:caspase-8 [Hippoglossus hippoglossus]|uniref:caspase-8 n=1 Tax=Hippoglossus hippoglossus TaxID=8267 RepID=UPI00148B9734|nr:caspase-8 [Hippoglossus hippoglossus]XP_034469221.1 caspase-8 [Hippoglossus hippoglossus]
MDRLKLFRIDEDLDSSEVAALCFLCLDVVNKKRLEGIKDARDLFSRLEERGVLENSFFLSQLLRTIRRTDLLSYLETDSRRPEETDASPTLSAYRVMLYNIYDDMTKENLEKMKFLLRDKLCRRQTEASDTALDLFIKMENTGILSNTNLHELLGPLQKLDQQLASTVQQYIDQINQQNQTRVQPHVSMDYERVNNRSLQPQLSISESQASYDGDRIHSDAESNEQPSSLPDEADYYALTHNPRGLCVVINNENFPGQQLGNRTGTQEDEKALRSVFVRLGFTFVILNDMTAGAMRQELKELGKTNFTDHDALVVCVLSHGEKGCVFGVDEQKVSLHELTEPFTSRRAHTLVGKPKLFFIQACQGGGYQGGSLPCPPTPTQEEEVKESRLEEDAGPIRGETVPWGADFLLGMATVPECKSFRHTSKGSIYIQELCRQLIRSAESRADDDILTVLTRVNRDVSKKDYMNHKQMPEPKYTLTRKLVLKFV